VVANAALRLLAQKPDLRVADLVRILTQTAVMRDELKGKVRFGALDMKRALQAI
jgi:hypothetical protein